MGKKLEIIFVTCMVLVILVGALLYFLDEARNVHVEKTEITGVTFTLQGFTIEGDMYINNPSFIPLPIKDMKYEILLNDDVLYQGTFEPFTLDAKTTTKVALEQTVPWKPTTTLLLSLITQENVILSFEGKAVVDLPVVPDYTLTYTQSVDVKEKIEELITPYLKHPGDPVSKGLDYLESILT